MKFTLAEIAEATDGKISANQATVVCNGATQDSRALEPGQLFVPLRAERDGHDFIESAIQARAAAYFTDGQEHPGAAAIRVADTTAALTALGRHARRSIPNVVAITGSAGKTTTKDYLAAALNQRLRVSATRGSFNNEIGMPLTLANADPAAEVLVAEIGARHRGDVAWGTDLMAPSIGVVVNVGTAHIGEFGSQDAIAQAKGELPEGLADSATAVLNADDHRVVAMAERTTARVVWFSTRQQVDGVWASDLSRGDGLDWTFTLNTANGSAPVVLPSAGPHLVECAAAAGAAAAALGIGVDDIAAGLSAAGKSAHRMDLRASEGGWHVLDDSYNANPASMRAAAQVAADLARSNGGRFLAVVGHMAELGPEAENAHTEIGDLLAELGAQTVIAVGALADRYLRSNGSEAPDALSAAELLLETAGPLESGDVVLVKASRSVGLDAAVPALVGPAR